MTERAIKYLSGFERIDYIKDVKFLEESLLKIGIQNTEKLIEFQLNYGGYVKPLRKEKFVYGIIHESPNYLEPLEFDWDNENGLIQLSAADSHISFGLLIDEHGTFYYDCIPNSESFELKIERDAFYAELTNIKPIKITTATKAQEDFIRSEIEGYLIEELTDEFCQFYYREGAIIVNKYGVNRSLSNHTDGFFLQVYLDPNNVPEIFKNLKFDTYY